MFLCGNLSNGPFATLVYGFSFIAFVELCGNTVLVLPTKRLIFIDSSPTGQSKITFKIRFTEFHRLLLFDNCYQVRVTVIYHLIGGTSIRFMVRGNAWRHCIISTTLSSSSSVSIIYIIKAIIMIDIIVDASLAYNLLEQKSRTYYPGISFDYERKIISEQNTSAKIKPFTSVFLASIVSRYDGCGV